MTHQTYTPPPSPSPPNRTQPHCLHSLPWLHWLNWPHWLLWLHLPHWLAVIALAAVAAVPPLTAQSALTAWAALAALSALSALVWLWHQRATLNAHGETTHTATTPSPRRRNQTTPGRRDWSADHTPRASARNHTDTQAGWAALAPLAALADSAALAAYSALAASAAMAATAALDALAVVVPSLRLSAYCIIGSRSEPCLLIKIAPPCSFRGLACSRILQ